MKKLPDLKINLPPWPAYRLVREACLSWNLRHPDHMVDRRTERWPAVRVVVFAFLRHRLTDYDQSLRDLCRHDPAARDGLHQAVEDVAWKVYPWLRTDPRPFREQTMDDNPKLLNCMADVATWTQTTIEHLRNAIDDFSRSRENPEHLKNLRIMLADAIQRRDDSLYALRPPESKRFEQPDPSGASGACSLRITPNTFGNYFFFGPGILAPCYYNFLPFNCPSCGARVAATKVPRDIGQGQRMFIQTCLCASCYFQPPPADGKLRPTTLENWVAVVKTAKEILEDRGDE